MNHNLVSSLVHDYFVVAENVCQAKNLATSYFNILMHLVYDRQIASGIQYKD